MDGHGAEHSHHDTRHLGFTAIYEAAMITAKPVTIQEEFPCLEAPGFIKIVLTVQAARDGRSLVHSKTCAKCRRSKSVLNFIKRGEEEYLDYPHVTRPRFYYVLTDTSLCRDCESPELLRIYRDGASDHFPEGRVWMRCRLHRPDGTEYTVWDEKKREHVPISHRGMHYYNDSTSKLAWQPYENRGQDKEGVLYR